MARLLGPDANSRLVYSVHGSTLRAAVGGIATVYVAETGSTLANIATYDGTLTPGVAITGSTLSVDSDSLLPLFWFPDGVDTVWVSVDAGTRVAVNADYDARLDLLVAQGDEIFNVRDYGVVGDDSADDTAGLNAAIDAAYAAGGGTVWIPPDFVCKVVPTLHGRALTARPGVTIASNGGTLRVPNGNAKYFAIISHVSTDDVSGFRMVGVTIDQNGANNAISSIVANEYMFVLMLMKGQDFLVRDCTFKNIDGLNTLDFNGATVARVNVIDNTFIDVGGTTTHDHSTIYTQGAGSVLISGNRFHGRLNAGAASPSAVCAIETHGSHTTITNNKVVDYRDGINFTGIAVDTRTSVCSNNTVYRAQRGINVFPSSYSGSVTPAMLGATVAGNVVYIDPDFWASSWDQWTTGIEVVSSADMAVEGLSITNNVVRFATYTGSSTNVAALSSSGILLSRTGTTTNLDREISITGNTVSGAIASSIYVGGYVEGLTIAGNTLSNAGHATIAVDDYKSGIALYGHIVRGVISGNNIYDTRVNGAQRYGIVWNCDSTSTGGQIRDNNIKLTNTTSAREVNVAASSGAPFVSHRATSGTTVATPTGAVAYGSRWTGPTAGTDVTQTAAASGTTWSSVDASGLLNRWPSERWVSPRPDSAVATAAPTSGFMALIPIEFGYPELINGLAWEVTTQGVDSAGSTDDLRFGLYADSGRRLPTGAALFTSAVQNLESNAPGVITLAVSWQLPSAGRFWLAACHQVTGTPGTAALLRCSTGSAGSQPYTSDSGATPTMGVVGGPSSRILVQTGVTGALPTIGTLGATTGYAPVLAFKVA